LAYRKTRQRRVAKALEIDTPNRIVEKRFVRIGGIDQWIQIRGEDRDNPVLLVLHGGPGWPNAVFTLPLRPWEQHFTVIQWDHRGAAMTTTLAEDLIPGQLAAKTGSARSARRLRVVRDPDVGLVVQADISLTVDVQ